MASGSQPNLARPLSRLFEDGTIGALTDGQLLERFATRRGEAAEAAFEGLVARHGSMVLRVCRGVLRDPHDVEDAFQAAFLVLVRKADSIGERDLIGPWLYGVAHRVALKARGLAARRRKREGPAPDAEPASVDEAPWLDLRPVLHEELNRLPEKYRRPVILCHLQGLTHAEAAQELAWPVGTVSVRLSRARKLLHDRLVRRGLTATASLWVTALTAEAASASVPPALIQSTAALALALAAGPALVAGPASAGVLALTRRTLTMTLASKWNWIALPAVLIVGVVGGSAATMIALPRIADSRKPESPPLAPEDVKPPLVVRGGEIDLDPPPGFFDLPATPNKGDGTDPPIIKPGQVIDVEVLEALPGRPIQGDRVVRPDGTISLGFYGDLRVAGLNRLQIKVKLIERLREYLSDEVLGLMKQDFQTGRYHVVPPVDSNRVFVDESGNFHPGGAEKSTRPLTTLYPDAAVNRISELEGKLDAVLKELRESKAPAPAAR